MNLIPGTESCTVRKGELEECRNMVHEVIGKVIDLGASNDDPGRPETALEALKLLRYIQRQLEDGLKPDPDPSCGTALEGEQ